MTGVAVVTGAASGLGAVIAMRLAHDGWTVGALDRDADGLARLMEGAGAGDEAVRPLVADVRSSKQVDAAFATASRWGDLRAVVLSAAVEHRSRVSECGDDEWGEVLDVDLGGPFRCMRAAVPSMVAAGGGAIVALGSTLGQVVAPRYAAYCAAKAALTNLCKQVAIEHAPDGIRVNVVAPSACDVGLFQRVLDEVDRPEALLHRAVANVPMRRLCGADEVADVVDFLVSDGARFISGAVIPLDGGLAARRIV